MSDKLLWLWLSLHFGAGTKLYNRLYNHFHSIQAIYDCDEADLASIGWLFPNKKKALLDKSLKHANQVAKWCERFGIEILTPADDKYPAPLRSLASFPAAIYCKGTLPDFENTFCISVVGQRKMTLAGMHNAFDLGYGLTKGGAYVISGMARGIDSTAQKGALYAGGSTIAVLGFGINVVYPRENFELMKKIMRVGAVITEYPPDTPPLADNFPVRNRLISALSRATVVVEASANSGSLITASDALEQNKDLFAFPGPVNNFDYQGNNMLLREAGAMLATEAIDILEKYMDLYKLNLSASKEKPIITQREKTEEPDPFKPGFWANVKQKPSIRNLFSRRKSEKKEEQKERKEIKNEAKQFDVSCLTAEEKTIYEAIPSGKSVTTEFFVNLPIDKSSIAMIITKLEIKGAITCLPGGFYKKN